MLAKLHTLFHGMGQILPLDMMLQCFTVLYHFDMTTRGLSHSINSISVCF